jgi:hypothetical protein
MKRIKHLILFILLTNVALLHAQDTVSLTLFSPKEMREDVEYFYEKLLETHPNPFQKLTLEQLKQKIDSLKNSLDKPLTLHEFWSKLASLNCYFDGHTGILPMDELFQYADKNQKFIIPVCPTFRIDNDRLYFPDTSLFWQKEQQGKEIKSINHIPVLQILRDIRSYFSNETPLLNNYLIQNLFMFWYNMSYDVIDSMEIEYRLNSDSIAYYTVYANNETTTKWKNHLNTILVKPAHYSLRYYPQDSIAIVELNTCMMSNEEFTIYKHDLRKFTDTIISIGIKHLFIDMSSNTGGNSVQAAEILNYIKTSKKKYRSTSVKIKLSPTSRKAFGLNKIRSLKDGEYYSVEGYYKPKHTGKLYKNNLYLIQGTLTYSSGAELSPLFKYHKIGTIIGEETGALTSGYIDIEFHPLPNSHIVFRCSMKEYVEPGSNLDGRGTLPDIEYPIGLQMKSFSLEELKEMLQLVQEKIV